MVENAQQEHMLMPTVRPFIIPSKGPMQFDEDDQIYDVEDSDEENEEESDFFGQMQPNPPRQIEPEESKQQVDQIVQEGCSDDERRRMDQNVIEYEKKLSDFERMFLYINDDLDFERLSQMAQELQEYQMSSE